ncbi:hypothetical protein C8T65DRAFT_209701 [Cerioporus squamosus]|nr:hypothetical protein C8T65DRAFT_209701 [Cerioporus squamosus]
MHRACISYPPTTYPRRLLAPVGTRAIDVGTRAPVTGERNVLVAYPSSPVQHPNIHDQTHAAEHSLAHAGAAGAASAASSACIHSHHQRRSPAVGRPGPEADSGCSAGDGHRRCSAPRPRRGSGCAVARGRPCCEHRRTHSSPTSRKSARRASDHPVHRASGPQH